jgi:TPR repeat protein
VLFLALGTLWFAWLVRLPWHLESFDSAKAAQLTPEKRAAYEQELFSEVLHWFDPTHRYPTWEPNYYLPREQRWLEMANDGFELAHIALRVLQPSAGVKYNAGPALRRLEELAEQGDQGAMCMMQSLSIVASPRDVTPQIDDRARYWMIKGGELGHPECLLMWGSRLLVGSDGQPKDPERGKALIFESIRKGYVHGLGVMAMHYEEKGLRDFADFKRLYCWEVWGAKVFLTMEPLKSVQYSINQDAPVEKRAEFLNQLNALRDWDPAVEECVALSRED